jgi:peptidylprolyl isomerase
MPAAVPKPHLPIRKYETTVRRLFPLVAAVLLVASLAACGGGGDDATSLPTVTGKIGEKPTVTAPDRDPSKTLVSNVITTGDGAKIARGDLVVVNYLGQLWRDNKAFDTSYGRAPVSFRLGKDPIITGWVDGLVGKNVGSRVLLVIPPDKGFGAKGLPDAGIKPDDTLVFVIDVLGTYTPTSSLNAAVASGGGGALPAVRGAGDKKPTITVPTAAKPPAKTTARTVIEGSGATVAKGDLVVVKYVGLSWSTGKQFDSSWDRNEPTSFTLDDSQVIKGWVEGLTGVKTGSRVLLVIPPDSGYGKAGRPEAGIKKNETLVFAVDVLGTF